MDSLPEWVVLASPVVALLASVVSALVAVAAIRSNDRNQREQRALQQNMQHADMEEKRQTDLRAERQGAYRKMGRVATIIDASKPYELTDLAEAHYEVEMLTNSSEVQEASGELYRAALDARRVARRVWTSGVRPVHKDNVVRLAVRRTHEVKGRFMDAARSELGLPARPLQAEYPLQIRQVMVPTDTQNGPERAPWWRRFFESE